MGSLRKIGRRLGRTVERAVGPSVLWKEDLRSLLHLVRSLGFSEDESRAEIWLDKKPGHFVPGVRVRAQGKEHAVSLAPVPGTLDSASRSWREFLETVTFHAGIFHASSVATPEFVEGVVVALEAQGFRIPAKERAEGNHLTPVAG